MRSPVFGIKYNLGLHWGEITAGASVGAVLVLGDASAGGWERPTSVTSFCSVRLGLGFEAENSSFYSCEPFASVAQGAVASQQPSHGRGGGSSKPALADAAQQA